MQTDPVANVNDNNPRPQIAPPGEPAAAFDLRHRLRRLARYTGVNLATLALDYAVFLPLTHSTGLPVVSSIVAYGIAFAANYRLSRAFVFGRDGSHKGARRLFTEFMATGVLGVALTAAVTAAGVYLLELGPAVSKTIAVVVCFAVLYFIRSRFVFTPSGRE